ncbi:hypothetical protein FE236_01400 [Mariprofundus erugo]|uniref:Flagellar protein n=2 Tax=Mariprofundus erugo TaxID=2528639 RepID=A0A5R9GKZ4_9PROT|nr:flagellar biosynthetic protein FliO [Mariprofundus erugo]TLS66790.1 hypothetical protein FEF65_09295 [Mariprofundus erugo]TLS78471.1 hypothetical protein FE236_01400 [Mariprofundus erugo]
MQSGMLAMLMQSLLGLAFVLGLFALLVWGMRRFQERQGISNNSDFRVVRKIHIDQRNSIVEITHQGQQYLLALSPGGVAQLRADHTINHKSEPYAAPPEQ